MKDTIVANIETRDLGNTLFVIRKTEGFIKFSYPVVIARRQVFLARSVTNKGLFNKRIEIGLESESGKITVLTIPIKDIENSPNPSAYEGLLEFFNVVIPLSAMPKDLVVKQIAFERPILEDQVGIALS